jgi:hypothetical protein
MDAHVHHGSDDFALGSVGTRDFARSEQSSLLSTVEVELKGVGRRDVGLSQ